MREVFFNLGVLILLAIIIWGIAYLVIYPKKVRDNIDKLRVYDSIVSFISLLVLYGISKILNMKFIFDGESIHNFVVCFFISVFTELPFFFRYKFKYKIDYEKVLRSNGWHLVSIIIGAIIGATIWILHRIFGRF